MTIPQKLNFTGKFEEGTGATMFYTVEKQQKAILYFSLN